MNAKTPPTERPEYGGPGGLVEQYLAEGFKVLRLHPETKRPVGKGWQDSPGLTLETAGRAVADGHPIGLQVGEGSGWLVCVDLDEPEAVKLAPHFLPETLRAGKGGEVSHYVYRSQGLGHAALDDLSQARLIDLKASANGKGHQFVVEPSVHARKGPYEWVGGFDPGKIREVHAAELREAVGILAAAAIVSRHLPAKGRHRYSLALAGFLLRHGVEPETVAHILRCAWRCAGAPGEHAEAAGRNAADTAETLGRGEAVMGGHVLEELVPGLARRLAKFLQFETTAETEPKASRNGPSFGTVKKWPVLDDTALYGLAGEIVRAVDPHTEADPVAVLVNFLAAFGNAAGRGAYVEVGADRHHLNLAAALVGKTSAGRKGTSWGPVLNLMHAADAEWADNRVLGGLSSGEGLINAVRDPVVSEGKDGEITVVDPGEPDKRLTVVETEFAGVLKVMTREGNTLSTILRQSWDGGKLATLTRNSPLRATGAHVSILAHITMDELLRRLSETDTHGGFTNRIIWLLVKRSKALSRGGRWNEVDVAPLVSKLTSALEFARVVGPITWGESGGEVWDAVYEELSEGGVGLVGAATSRAAPQTLRLAALYAVMDQSPTIERDHVLAALALWDYAEESARYVFGTATGDPVVDRIMEALRETKKGLTRTMINNDLFGGHQKSERIATALNELRAAGMIRSEREPTKGRPVDRWFLA